MEKGSFEPGSLDEMDEVRDEALKGFMAKIAIRHAFNTAMQSEDDGKCTREEALTWLRGESQKITEMYAI